ncbi:hypothetical protein CHU71_02535 [Corynebacterium sp. LK14]|nr:hypothetical protein CHU71_02535 [Corynebacterium sp. LK14]
MARGRPATPLGTHGEVHVTPLSESNNKFRASTYLRLLNGKTVRVRATGASEAKAKRALEERCAQRLQGEDNEELGTTSRLSRLIELWIAQHDVSESSRNTYQKCIDLHINQQIGDIRLNELSTQKLQAFLESLSPGTAKTARAALGSAAGLAVRWGVMNRNPVRDTKLKATKRKDPNALTDKEMDDYRNAVEKWCGSNEMGTKRGESLLEIVDVLRGSGMRIGEVLGLVWSDIDLDKGTVAITGQVDNKGGRKNWPKTESSRRIITVNQGAVNALRRQWEKEYRPYMGDTVFPTRNGTFRTVANVEGDLRKARGEMKIVPHDFRKTVATRIEEKYGMLAASRYLGHSSTKVTEQSYLARPDVLPNYTDAF